MDFHNEVGRLRRVSITKWLHAPAGRLESVSRLHCGHTALEFGAGRITLSGSLILRNRNLMLRTAASLSLMPEITSRNGKVLEGG